MLTGYIYKSLNIKIIYGNHIKNIVLIILQNLKYTRLFKLKNLELPTVLCQKHAYTDSVHVKSIQEILYPLGNFLIHSIRVLHFYYTLQIKICPSKVMFLEVTIFPSQEFLIHFAPHTPLTELAIHVWVYYCSIQRDYTFLNSCDLFF